MEISRRLSRIVGPFLIALPITEGANIAVFADNPAPVVYLNGTLLFVAGVAILQAYHRWSWTISTLITGAGWAMTLAGLYRMALPAANQLAEGPATYAVLAVLTAVGGLLCFKGYGPARSD